MRLLALPLLLALHVLHHTATADPTHSHTHSHTRYVSLCNRASEPTLGELFAFASPIAPEHLTGLADAVSERVSEGVREGVHETTHHGLLFRAVSELLSGAAHALAETKVPLASLVADGVFSLSASSHRGRPVESEIKVLQRKPFLQRHLCALAGSPLVAPLTHSLSSFVPSMVNPCHCWSGMSLLDTGMSMSDMRVSDALLRDEDWCVIEHPCEDHTSEDHTSKDHTSKDDALSDQCRIRVDPLRQACAVFLVSSPSGDDVRHSQEDALPSSAYYRFEVPTLQDAPALHSWLTSWSTTHPLATALHDHYLTHVAPFLTLLPYYPIMFLLAVALLHVEEDVADSTVVQFVVTVVLGVLLAVIALMAVLYRQINSLKNNIPFASFIPSTLSSALVSVALFASSFSMKEALLHGLWSFWSHGAFGVTWAGKAYFTVSVSLSLWLKWYYSLFEEESKSHSVLRMIMKFTALRVLVAHASPSTELACLFALVALSKDSLVGWEQVVRTEIVGNLMQTPTVNYSGQAPLSEEEYQRQGRETTQKALHDLQKHLQNNVNLYYDLTDKHRERGNDTQARLFERFVTGSYSGKPSEYDRERILRGENPCTDEYSDDVSDDYSSDDEEVRQMKKARRRAKRRASRGRSVMWTVLLVLLVSVLVAFVYKPVAIGGGDGAEWQDALAELSESALNTVQRLRQEFSAGDL